MLRTGTRRPKDGPALYYTWTLNVTLNSEMPQRPQVEIFQPSKVFLNLWTATLTFLSIRNSMIIRSNPICPCSALDWYNRTTFLWPTTNPPTNHINQVQKEVVKCTVTSSTKPSSEHNLQLLLWWTSVMIQRSGCIICCATYEYIK